MGAVRRNGDRPAKLATITQRIEARDYVDVAALLAAGLSIDQGAGALLGLYGNQASGLQSVKTMAWFKEGNLEQLLPANVKDRLTQAARAYDPHTTALPRLSDRLD